jgi:hypothetical protein
MSNCSPPAVLRPWKCDPYQDATPTSSHRLDLAWEDSAFAWEEFALACCSGPAGTLVLGAWSLLTEDVPSLAEAVIARPIINTPTPNFRTDIGDARRAVLKEVLLIHTLLLLLSLRGRPKSNIQKQLAGK